MLWVSSLPASAGDQRAAPHGNAEEHEEDAERRRQEARPHMHQSAGPVGRTLEGDAEAEQDHQAASVKVTLAHEVAERAGGRSHNFLPAVFGAVTC